MSSTINKVNVLPNILTPLPDVVCDIIYEYYKLPFLSDLIECFKNKEEATRRLMKYHKVWDGVCSGTHPARGRVFHYPPRFRCYAKYHTCGTLGKGVGDYGSGSSCERYI